MGLYSFFERRGSVTASGERGWHLFGNGSQNAISDHDAAAIPTVYTCVDIISSTISSLPTDVVKSNGRISLPVDKPSWLKRPNGQMTVEEFWRRVSISLLINGNAYIYVARGRAGEVLELLPINPNAVKPELVDGVKYFNIGNEKQRLTTRDIVHIVGWAMPGDLVGRSPISAEATMRMASGSSKFGSDFYGSGLRLSGVIEVPGTPKPEEAARLKQEFASKNRGPDAIGLGVLTGGATFKSIVMSPADAQLIDSIKFNATQIAAMYRVPGYMAGTNEDSTNWGSGIEEQNKNFIQRTIVPWVTAIEQAVNYWLLEGDLQLKFNVSAQLRGTDIQRAEYYAKMIQIGAMTPNEVRALENIGPIEGGDEAQISQNLKPLNENNVNEGVQQ
jgi:HK97 family phage portal protein